MKSIITLAAACVLWASMATVLAAGDPVAGANKAASCAACHSADGNSVNPQWPKLAGQHGSYLLKQLQAFKAGQRENALMSPMVIPLSDQDMADLAAYYASVAITPGLTDPALLAEGEALYRGGDREKGIAACSGCHGPSGQGNPAAKFPVLAGQHGDYTGLQLQAFRAMQRANDPNNMMRAIAAKLSDRQIQAVASYIQGLRR